ncbi:ABC transporter ATP-binding protein [Paenibacillus fonticola]|uniref:ABC transporter ATP-binding protein n=1 Tax=Paenibacillus fonticola TaxID=379896 RepID=UPI0003739782|nr:ABC transporter ATP-binding protein [Paenibacillus fonticola]
MKGPAIELQNVTYRYEPEDAAAVEDVSITVQSGEWLAITGSSGSGKSTLVQLLNGYLPRSGGGERQGAVLVDGYDPAESDIAEVVRRIGIVFQDPDAQLVQGRVEDEAAFGPENLRIDVPAIERRVTDALAAVDLAERRFDSVHTLSGGQRQRTAIAAVLALEPPVLVFDEPVASLDARSRRRFLALLRQLHSEGRTLITVSGRLDMLASAAPRLIVMDGGKVAMDGPAAELTGAKRARLIELGVLPAVVEPQDTSLQANACALQQVGGPAAPAANARALPQASAYAALQADACALPQAGAYAAPAADARALPQASAPAAPHEGTCMASGAAGAAMTANAGPPAARQDAKASASHQDAKASAAQPLLQISGLTFAYSKTGPTILSDVNATLAAGEWRLLCGENGSGKTTLSRLLMGLLSPPHGTIWWRGKDAATMKLYDLAEDIGYVFQQPEHQFVAATVIEELLYGSRFTLRLAPGKPVPEHIDRRAQEMLQCIGLDGREQDSPYLLSGGEKRLLSAAAAMMLPKKLYILDEPTAGADYKGANALAALCRRAVADGAAVIIVTHEPECFIGEDLSVWTMKQGRLHM